MHTCVYTCTHVNLHICVRTAFCVCTYIYVYAYVYTKIKIRIENKNIKIQCTCACVFRSPPRMPCLALLTGRGAHMCVTPGQHAAQGPPGRSPRDCQLLFGAHFVSGILWVSCFVFVLHVIYVDGCRYKSISVDGCRFMSKKSKFVDNCPYMSKQADICRQLSVYVKILSTYVDNCRYMSKIVDICLSYLLGHA